MNIRNIVLTWLSACAVLLSFGSSAQNNHHEKPDYLFEDNELASLPINSLTIFNDEQFVLNNQLALNDWDSFFDSYAQSIKQHQEIVMHWAGLYSINPKILVALMELQSKVISQPNKTSLKLPFAHLSNKQGFSEQVEDVAEQLSQRFYAYKKLTLSNDNKLLTPTTASTVSLVSLLNKHRNKKHKKQGKSLLMYDFLSSYEQLFAEPTQTLMLSAEQISKPVEEKKARSAGFAMRLPWPTGYSWRAGGAHSNTGSGWPYSSLDFYNPYGGGWGSNTPWVQAANSGQIVRFSSCHMRIIHSSGYATSYYHMSNLQYGSNTYVNRGDWIGKYANNKSQALCEGGQSTGPHLHFSLLRNGSFTSLQGHSLSDFNVYVGNSNYDTNCNVNFLYKNGQKYCANTNLYNNWN